MKKYIRFILFSILFLNHNSNGQTVDSLKRALIRVTSVEKGKLLFDIGNYYLLHGEVDSCIFYTERASELLESDIDLSNAYENIGMSFYYKSDFANALENFKISAVYGENTGNDSIIARRYSDLGVVYDYLGAYDKAIEYYFKAVKLFENKEDRYGIAKIYNNLGIINETLGKYDIALSYYKKALNLKQKVSADSQDLASTYVNIGSVLEKNENPDDALAYYKKALKIFEQKNNIRYSSLCLNNIANVYFEKADFYQAEKFVRKAIDSNKNNLNSMMLSKSYIVLSQVLISENKSDEAADYLKKAKEIAYKQNLTDQKIIIIETEIRILKQKQDFEKAFKIQEKYLEFKDSLHRQNLNEKVEKLQIVYETDKKEQKIKQLSQEIKQKRMVWISSLFLLLLILSVVYLFFRNKLNKSKLKNYEFNQKLLRSQMNPHFIFNALNSVQMFMLESDTKQAAMYLSAFSKLSRSILDNSRKEFITVSEEIETADNYLKIQQLRIPDLFDYEIIVDEFDTDFYLIPPMLTQPFIENALLHAFKNINYKGKIEIRFAKTDKLLKISVRDNGKGYQINLNKKHRSHATEITVERLKILKKQTKTDIKFEIVNLSDISDKSGTEATFTLPLIRQI